MQNRSLLLPRRCLLAVLTVTIAVSSLLAPPALAQSADWPYWRGPEFDGTAQASGLPEQWDLGGSEDSNVVWKREDLEGLCTPIVMNGRLYTIQRSQPGTPREGERVVCLDAATGETIWENSYNVWMSDVPAERIGWTSVVGDQETGNIYALGACDIFNCIDGETGETIWSIPLHEQFGMLSTYGGRTNFPVVHEDLVIISGIIINWGDRAKPNHRLIAMDKRTGETVWFSGTRDLPYDTTYSAPSLVTIDGQRQLVIGAGDGALWGFQPRTGKQLWHYDFSRRGLFASPLVVGDRVFASHSEENISGSSMGAAVGLRISGTGDETSAEQLWKIEDVVAGFSEPVLVDGRLYLVDDRCKMYVIDAETGELIVEQKAFAASRQRAALVYADGKIYVMTENRGWAVLQPTEDGFEVLNRGRMPERTESFAASPIVADGRLYLQSTSTLYCVATGHGEQAQVLMAEAMGEETPVTQNPQPAQLQIVPAEALLKPGESVELKTNFFNVLGQEVNASGDVTFEVEGPGSINGSSFVASPDAAHAAATITARYQGSDASDAGQGGLTATARVRIVPPLPWKFTFDNLQEPPVSWVGARYRHVIREVDGSHVLTKVNTIPKGARSRAWMGPSDLSEYTIAADVRGTRMNDQLPDIGLTNHGYALDLQGQSQKLQIRTWATQLRMAKSVDFPWQEDTWYRMKFRSDIEGEGADAVAVLKGKVWPRDEPEPEQWTITAKDESPNLAASPGLYGSAKVAEFYLDNVEVTDNE